jgi:hypothetical protein
VGTSKENVESNWVRNEWSRYIDRIQNEDDLHRSSFIPVFKDMNPYDMTKINNAFVQGVDASKIGYLTTLVDGVMKILKPEKEQKILSAFENLDNYAEFTKIQKQKSKELKARRWEEFKQTKGMKKWWYYLLIYSPIIFAIPYLILCTSVESLILYGKTYALVFISMIVMLALSIVALCVHAKRFKVDKIFNVAIPFVTFALGFVLYFVMYFYAPITVGGLSAYNVGNCYRGDGYYYYIENFNIGKMASIQYLDKNGEYKNNIKIENGKKVFYLPDKIDDILVAGVYTDIIPSDVQIIVIPRNDDFQFRISGDANNLKNVEEIYCYDFYDVSFQLSDRGVGVNYDERPFKLCCKYPENFTTYGDNVVTKDGGYYD